jgi:hypothetical protein
MRAGDRHDTAGWIPNVRKIGALLPALVVALVSCGGTAGGPTSTALPSSFVAPSFATCEAAFRSWIANAASMNSPGVDVMALAVASEAVQRRVFELCSLAEAERLNREVPIEYVPGRPKPMIEPDFRTFAEVECVDEAPLLDGTPLCAEVGR